MIRLFSFFRLSVVYIIILINLTVVYGNDSLEKIKAFELRANIQTWPTLDGCRYSESFVNKIVGLIINVKPSGNVYARWDGRCHVPIKHELIDWPMDLGPGKYVVAATTILNDNRRNKKNRILRIIAVLGKIPTQEKTITEAINRICLSPLKNGITDRDCDNK
jgi:hypothetical protein